MTTTTLAPETIRDLISLDVRALGRTEYVALTAAEIRHNAGEWAGQVDGNHTPAWTEADIDAYIARSLAAQREIAAELAAEALEALEALDD